MFNALGHNEDFRLPWKVPIGFGNVIQVHDLSVAGRAEHHLCVHMESAVCLAKQSFELCVDLGKLRRRVLEAAIVAQRISAYSLDKVLHVEYVV